MEKTVAGRGVEGNVKFEMLIRYSKNGIMQAVGYMRPEFIGEVRNGFDLRVLGYRCYLKLWHQMR